MTTGRAVGPGALAAIIVAAVVLSACSSAPSDPGLQSSSNPVVPTPLTSSVASQTATWATVAMGHLDDPVNTFWQLVSLPAATPTWKLATPPGVASNGGLVTTVDTSGAVTAGFEPSLQLQFSPLARSTDGGAIWAPGVLPGGLALTPDSLASSPGHQYLAVLRSGNGVVVSSGGDLTSWTKIATPTESTAGNPSAGCQPEALTAVAIDAAGDAVVGAGCARGDRAGIFDRVDGSWQSTGPTLPTAGPSQVLRLVDTSVGVTALVSTGAGNGRRLFGLWSADGLKTWSVSTSLPIGGASLTSTGITATGGLVVAVNGTDGHRSASTIGPQGHQWQGLATPPAGTSTVVATPSGGFDVADRPPVDPRRPETLGVGGWHQIQALPVPIQYGSSG